MQNATKSAALLFIALLILPVVLQTTIAQQGSTSVAPRTLWQQNYGQDYSAHWGTEAVSNLIETSEGGFAFLTSGFARQNWLHPATLYKVNSTGNIEWTKQFEHFAASAIIQTSDGGYEIVGNWRTPTVYDLKPTLIKTDSNGTIQWNQNYTSIPQLNINAAVIQNGSTVSTMIKTSDDGYAYIDWSKGIVKTDQNKHIQWTKNTTYSEEKTIQSGEETFVFPAIPATMCSLIETSDGHLRDYASH